MHDKQCVVSEYEIARGIFDLPNVQSFDVTSDHNYDLIILPIGFEQRATNLISKLAEKRGTVPNKNSIGLLATYLTNIKDNEKNHSQIITCLNQLCSTVETFEADSPQNIFNTIVSTIDRLYQSQRRIRVAFDISGASGTLIISTMKGLLERANLISIDILYTEASDYYPDKSSFERDPTSVIERCCMIGDPEADHEHGVELVDVNELYPGHSSESRRELVIAIPSFRTERLRQCLQYVSEQVLAAPHKHIFWIFGSPPSQRNLWRKSLQRSLAEYFMHGVLGHDMSLEKNLPPQLNEGNSQDVSTLDYRESTRLLIEIADAHIGKSISLLHMGSKMQAFGLSLALQARSEITLCYSRPSRFNSSRYSDGIGNAYCVHLDHPENVLHQLRKIGTLEFSTGLETDQTGRPTF